MLISMLKSPWPMRYGHHGILTICVTLVFSAPIGSEGRASDLPSGDAPRPRLQVKIPDPAEEAIRDLVTRTAEAVNNEDLDGVIEGMRRGKQAATRRRLGLLFATHTVAMDLEDQHFLVSEATRAEVAVKYRLTLSGRSHDVVSIVVVLRVGGGVWVIDREEIQSNSQAVLPSANGDCGEGVICIGGRCAVP